MAYSKYRLVPVGLATSLLIGCGGMSAPGSVTPGPQPVEHTDVTFLLSSTANDQLVQANLTFTSFTLTDKVGNTVEVLAAPESAEFTHLNGNVESLVTLKVPQGVYTAASATLGPSNFSCVIRDSSGGLMTGSFSVVAAAPTVSLPQPIAITGVHMAMLLNLEVSPGQAHSICYSGTGSQPYTVTPALELTRVAAAVQPTNSENGKESNLEGLITAIAANAGSFNVAAADRLAWSVATNGSTVFQGVGGFSELVAGLPVDMDVTLQADGSLLATRVAVTDTSATDLTIWHGPLVFVSNAVAELLVFNTETRGQLFPGTSVDYEGGPWGLGFGSAAFRISAQFSNLQSLPFSASFNATNMVAGQNVYVTTHVPKFPNSPNLVAVTTVTLVPQTINGTVTAVSSAGGFTTYTVALAAYDLFSALAQQPGQTTILNSPNSVVVYVDGSTQMLNSMPLAEGSVLRFNGLVFNDNGTLRMDCAQVMDGVTP